MEAIIIGTGGFLGAILRYGIHLQLTQVQNIFSLYPTALINLSGSFFMGIMLSVGRQRFGEGWYYFLVTGLLGGFTTYSAFSGETILLLKNAQYQSALIYCSLTFFGGIFMAFLGFILFKFLSTYL
jgi:CrcB protein